MALIALRLTKCSFGIAVNRAWPLYRRHAMTGDAGTLPSEHRGPTQHAMLIAWGYFARALVLTQPRQSAH
jgi:hypothetical protein